MRWLLLASSLPLTACLQLSTDGTDAGAAPVYSSSSGAASTGSSSGGTATSGTEGTSLYDLECGCGDSLCPIGVPTSCTTAQQLLDQEGSALIVCEQVSNGTCLPLAGDAGASSTTSSSCDKACQSECAGDPDCSQLCGC
jgi:hypothetical protein